MRPLHLLAALAASAALLSCISDRVEVTAPGTGECRIDIGSGAVGTTLVAIRDFAFHPATLRVPRGTTVTWVNCEPAGEAPHTSEGDEGEWTSPLLASGDDYSHTFDQTGSFSYHCGPHPFMTATVIVE